MKYYLGIDGGGTKTTAVIIDECGNVLLTEVGKTINFYSVGINKAKENLKILIDDIISSLGEITFSGAFIGCSALDCEADEKTLKALCDGIVISDKIKMNSDVYIALKSLDDAPCSAVAICGTGSMAIGVDKNGNTITAGGWGHILGDEGSAYSIATLALKECCFQHDKGFTKTDLIISAERYFNVSNFKDIIPIIYSIDTSKEYIAGFAKCVSELANNGDDVCKNIIISQAADLSLTVNVLLNRTKACKTLGLYGGVFENNLLFRETFTRMVLKSFPNLEIKLLTRTPAETAAKLAREL